MKATDQNFLEVRFVYSTFCKMDLDCLLSIVKEQALFKQPRIRRTGIWGVFFTFAHVRCMECKDMSFNTYLSGLSGESSSSSFSSITGIGTGCLGFFSADFKGFFFKLLSTDGVSEVAAEPDTPLSRMISGTALNEGWSFLRSTFGISSSPVSEEESPSTSLLGSSSGVVSAQQSDVRS